MTKPVFPRGAYYLTLASGLDPEFEIIQKFGKNESVGTTFEPISYGGIYRTPQVSGATAVRVKAGDADDTAGGSGAQEITVQGIDANGDLVSEAIATNGLSAGANSSTSFIRIFRAWVSKSGTYGTQSTASHAAAIVIENAAGTEDWLTIDGANFPSGQSDIGAYTVPNGYEAYVKNIFIHVDSGKTAELEFFQRQNILDTAAPYQAIRKVYGVVGVIGAVTVIRDIPLGPFPAQTDIGMMGRVPSTAADISVNFDIILKRV